MRKRVALLAGLAALVAAFAAVAVVEAGAGGVTEPSPADAPAAAQRAPDGKARLAAKRRPAPRARLKAFRSCTDLVRYARRNALSAVGPQGVPRRFVASPLVEQPRMEGDGAPPPAAQPAPTTGAGEDFSQTNVQEAGVDEPDVVKSDGSRIFAISGETLHAVDARAETPRLLGSLRLEEGYGHELLLHERRALVVSHLELRAQPLPDRTAAPSAIYGYFGRPATLFTELDVSDPAAMRVVRTQQVEGAYLSSRLTGRTARVVVSSPPRALELPLPAGGGGPEAARRAEQRNRRALGRSRVPAWRPRSVLENARTGRTSRRPLVACGDVRRPVEFSGLDMLTVVTIDLAKGLPAIDSDGLLTDGQTVYASTRNLYVATERWFDPTLPPDRLPALRTAIHRFDVSDADSTSYRASGEVLGSILSQWSLSEHKGFLRVASTEAPLWLGGPRAPRESESFVSVLDEKAGRLVEVGRVGGLGRGERIYAVRFIDDAGFVVTFRQVDPLYTLDLSRPAEPKVRGELKVRGYSAYLHPIDGDLLLGVGQDATEEGRTLGTQLSPFDVSDLSRPVRLHQRALGSSSSSEVEFDHHAFLYWGPSKLAVIPVQVYEQGSNEGGRQQGFVGAIGFNVDRAAGIDEAGRASHPKSGEFPWPIRRSLVVGGRLFTLSDAGVLASTLDRLQDLHWVPFR